MTILGLAIMSNMAILAIFDIFGHNGPNRYSIKSGFYTCHIEQQEKGRPAVKTVFKNIQLVKSYGHNKFFMKIIPISFVFWTSKWPVRSKHFPVDFRLDLYVFGFRKTKRMGIRTELIKSLTFVFLSPPSMQSKFSL